jgi:integrase
MARGSIIRRERKGGSATYAIKYRDSTGRQVMTSIGPDRREAERALTAALSERDRGIPARRASREKFAEYADRWLADHRTRIESGTHAHYRSHLERRLKPYFGQLRLGQITREQVRCFVAQEFARGELAPMTINHSVILLSTMLGHAVEDGLIPSNVAGGRHRRSRLTLPRPHAEMDYLKAEEIPVYLDGCTREFRPLAEVLTATGLRIGEALALIWADVDWQSGAMIIARNSKATGLGSTKSKRVRRVENGPRLLGILRDLRAIQTVGDPADASGLIFPHPNGGVQTRARAWYFHKAACKKAGLRQTLRLHDLRHSAAAMMLAAGLPMIYVQRQLGHADIGTTINRYGHLEESFLQGAAKRAEASIWYRADVLAARQ